MLVYNFLAARWAEDDLARRRIKISRFDDLNDPFELLAVELKNKADRRRFRAVRDHMCANRGVICFSKSWHNSLLWSHYADKHRGVCLGFEVPDEHIVPVLYDSKRLPADISKLRGHGPEAQALMSRLLRTKFKDWKYEDEIRVYTSLQDVDTATGHYFKDFGPDLRLREVILGSRHTGLDSTIIASARAYPSVSIVQARLAFGSFKVVPNLRKRVV